MNTLTSILKEMKDIPVNRLEDLYSFVHSLNTKPKKSSIVRKAILAFAGAFSDMSSKDYTDFLKETKKVRSQLFDRKVSL
jgi:hypothetical protein